MIRPLRLTRPRLFRNVTTSSSVTPKPKPRRTTRRLAELPSVAVADNGTPLPPLPSFPAPSRTLTNTKPPQPSNHAPPPKASTLSEEDRAYERAIQDGEFPRTPLAREIFMNMRAYEGDIVLTRVGMFYESYFTQAAEVAGILGIRLTGKAFTTSRSKESIGSSDSSNPQSTTLSSSARQFPFAGFPVSQRDKYFPILISQNRSFVVVEERASTPGKTGKTRFVERRYTPGTLCNEPWQVDSETRTLLAISFRDPLATDADKDARTTMIDIAYIDISTDRAITCTEITLDELEHELTRVSPVEIVLDSRIAPAMRGESTKQVEALKGLVKGTSVFISYVTPSTSNLATNLLTTHLRSTLLDSLPTLLPPTHLTHARTMQIDASTLQGLEVRHSLRSTSHLSRVGTLISVIKRTITPSGTRLLIKTLTQPSAHLPFIINRHALVQAFLERPALREDLRSQLRALERTRGKLGEIVRIIQRFSGCRRLTGGTSAARDLLDLRDRILGIQALVQRISEEGLRGEGERIVRLRTFVEGHRELDGLVTLIDGAVSNGALDSEEEETERSGVWWLRHDFNPVLAGLHAQVQVLEKRQKEMQESLRRSFNTPTLELKTSPFAPGLFVHVPAKKSNAGLVEKDERMIPLRSGKTAKTYLFGPWTVLGLEIQGLHDQISRAQEDAFNELRQQILARQDDLFVNAGLLDELDLSLGFAQVADELRWVRPEMQEEPIFDVVNARHPTVEYSLMTSPTSPRPFIPNDMHIRILVLTGPNQGGKSTFLRQAAIISILAQAGSFVPADRATLGIVDAVFSRVGARDDLYMDMSTFMLEMHETAYILAHATPKSLVIIDEIGRGTSYHSGIAIAYATLDYILRHIGCRTLFATHYHELCDILQAESSTNAEPRGRQVEYWHTDLDESAGRFSYSYRLKRGVNRESHAIKTAQQARMPRSFLDTVERMLGALEGKGA